MSGNRIYRLRLVLRDVLQLCVSHGTPKRAARLSIVVGSMLVLINQWEAITGEEAINWFKVALTYCVPYVVTTYTSVSKDLQMRRAHERTEAVIYEGLREDGADSDQKPVK